MQKKRFQLKQALRVSVVRRQFLLQMKAKYAGELYIFISTYMHYCPCSVTQSRQQQKNKK